MTIAITAAPGASAAMARMAHATLVTTYPLDGALVKTEPARVAVNFDQPVGVSADSLIVFTPAGQRADVGGAQHDGPDGIEIALISGLGTGTYTVAWHVVSADSHPVQGAFTFSVGAPSPTHVPPILPAGSHWVSAVYAVVRWLEYAFFAVLGGGMLFLIVCWPAGTRRRGVPQLVTAGWAGLFTASLAALLFQGVYAAGAGFGQLLEPSLELTTLHSRLGTALQWRQGLTVAAALLATFLIRRLPALGTRARGAAAAAWLLFTAAIAASWAGSDHASTGFQVPLAVGVDIVHLVAMAVWLGGLVVLGGFALRGPATEDVAVAVPRFSAIALGCVTLLAASGGYEAWRLVGTLGALTGTSYGVLVLVKAAGLVVLVGLGYTARRFVHRRLLHATAAVPRIPALAVASVGSGPGAPGAGDAPGVAPGAPGAPDASGTSGGLSGSGTSGGRRELPSMRSLRVSVSVELAVVAVVLAATAILVNTPTGRESYAPPVSATAGFDTGGPGGAGTVHAVITPARLGPDSVELTLATPDGQPLRAAQVQAELFFPARGLGPLPVPLTLAGQGRYRAVTVTFGFSGQWELRVTVRSDAFDETTVTIPATIH
jgi:copper transport protein